MTTKGMRIHSHSYDSSPGEPHLGKVIEQDDGPRNGSGRLLAALIRYGLNHDRHLGMGAERFYATARKIGSIA